MSAPPVPPFNQWSIWAQLVAGACLLGTCGVRLPVPTYQNGPKPPHAAVLGTDGRWHATAMVLGTNGQPHIWVDPRPASWKDGLPLVVHTNGGG